RALREQRTRAARRGLHHVGEGEAPYRDLRVALDPGELEQRGDDPSKGAGVAGEAGQEVPAHRVVELVPVALERQPGALDHREGRAELVGDGGKEVALHTVELLQPIDRPALLLVLL